ncbi:MAG: hypothetical protein JXB23_18125 [Candidatus Aminicenantes bacterium]|nr:hypothetical protein [Candidatus Aminicenantes bacterium]
MIITMGKKGLALSIIVFFITLSVLPAQSLVEAAKKERERRAKLNKKAEKVITNEDLKKMKRMPGVSTTADQEKDGEETRTDPVLASPRNRDRVRPKQVDDRKDSTAGKALEQKYEKAKEYAELLTIKLNGLWQKYHNLDDATPKERVQSEISQTYLLLQKAQLDAEKAKDDWDAFQKKSSE